ncbi:MAG: MYXO-CTERM sorting domain-containing protein [Phycisphaerales bacterium]
MRVRLASLAALAGLAVAASTAQAEFRIIVDVTAEIGGQAYPFTLPEIIIDDGSTTATWEFTDPVYFGEAEWANIDGGNGVMTDGRAALNGLSFNLVADPIVNASFNVAAGFMNTTFTINSAVVSFGDPDITVGRAAAAITFTDSLSFGTPGQIAFAGLLGPGNDHAFTARYNGTTLFNDGVLLPGGIFSVTPGSTHVIDDQSSPGFEFLPLGGTATSINSQFKFSLSAFDRAAGTSTFEVIPTPGSLALLGLGAVVTLRRRRSA